MSRYNDGFREHEYEDYGGGRGNGYDHDAGMSNNALDAYDRGVKPLSRITVLDLNQAGWRHTKAFAKFLAAEGFWSSAEWHHSGGEWFNKVDFYDPAELVSKWLALDDAGKENWKTRHAESRKSSFESDGRCVEGSYTLWGGTRRRPQRIGRESFTGTLIGDWIHVSGGGRKKASGAHINWHFVEESN